MVDRREVIEDESQARLELLPELPSHGQRSRRVVENVADEVQAGDLAGNGRAVHYE